MNEAETRVELIDPELKAAGWCVLEASPIRREAVTRVRQPAASKPPSHIHGPAIIGYPNPNIPRLIEDVGDHRRRPGVPGEPIAMQLGPPKPISRLRRIGPMHDARAYADRGQRDHLVEADHEPGDLRTSQRSDQPPGPADQNRDRAPVRHRGRGCGVCPVAQAKGKPQGLLLKLFKGSNVGVLEALTLEV
jgi:hypothetical protein